MDSKQEYAAALYKEKAKLQREGGREFIDEICPKPGDTILDLGCGTGELTVYLAELVGPTGKVIGVDPDCARIKLAQESYQHIENLTFVEGCGVKFPDMELGKYDLIFSNYVFHWIFNKEQVLSVAYRSLKPGGKIALQHVNAIPALMDKVFKEFFPDKSERIMNRWCLEGKDGLEKYHLKVGFKILNSVEFKLRVFFDSIIDFCKWVEGVSHGVADVQSIPRERLEQFAHRVEGQEGKVFIDQLTQRMLAVKLN